MIAVNIAVIKAIAEWLLAVSGAVAVIVAIVKRMLKPILQPLKEVTEKQKHFEECLDRDKKRLDKLDSIMELIVQDNAMELMTLKQVINHMRTNNNTDQMQKIEDDIDKYMATRK